MFDTGHHLDFEYLRVENARAERYKAEAHQLTEERDALMAENARLREVLEAIASHEPDENGRDMSADSAAAIARRALRERGEE